MEGSSLSYDLTLSNVARIIIVYLASRRVYKRYCNRDPLTFSYKEIEEWYQKFRHYYKIPQHYHIHTIERAIRSLAQHGYLVKTGRGFFKITSWLIDLTDYSLTLEDFNDPLTMRWFLNLVSRSPRPFIIKPFGGRK